MTSVFYLCDADRSNGATSDVPGTHREHISLIVEISPNRLLLVHDRIPVGWRALPSDSDERCRIYVMPLEVERA